MGALGRCRGEQAAHAVGRVVAGHEQVEEAVALAVREHGHGHRGLARWRRRHHGRVGHVEEELDVWQPRAERQRLEAAQYRQEQSVGLELGLELELWRRLGLRLGLGLELRLRLGLGPGLGLGLGVGLGLGLAPAGRAGPSRSNWSDP